MTLGQKINTLRSDKGLTQKELAAKLGIKTGAIAEWEADESAPSLLELSSLSKVLNVSSDILLDAATDAVPASVITPKQESVPVIVPANKRTGKGWIIGVAVLCVALIAAVVVLWSQGVFTPESLLFSEDTEKIENADASVVTIFCYDYDGELAATGSGFVAFDSKTIITNYHVMTSAYTCNISTNQDISYDVSNILCYSKEQDIAILQLAKDTGLKPLTFGDSSIIKKGETVVAIGSPLGIKNTVSTGVLSGRLMEDNMDVLQFTAPISSGSSGGALFDDNGNVIGITYASYIDGQNLNLAIPIEVAINLYQNIDQIQDFSSFYLAEHPYAKYLGEYRNIPLVTISDLKSDPTKYNNVIVMLRAFIWSDNKLFYDTNSLYVGEEKTPPHNLNTLSSNRNFEETPQLDITFQSECKYKPVTIYPEDEIVIIGEFEYSAIGDSFALPINGEWKSHIRTTSSAFLRVHIMYYP